MNLEKDENDRPRQCGYHLGNRCSLYISESAIIVI